MRSKDTMKSGKLWVSGVSALAVVLVGFGCSKHSSPVSPRELGDSGKIEMKFTFPRSQAVTASDIYVMASHADFGQIEDSAVPVFTSTPTSFPYVYYGSADLELVVPSGPDRHVMAGYHDSFNNDQYAYARLNVLPGINTLDLALGVPQYDAVDVGYMGLFYDFDAPEVSAVSFSYVPGQSDVEFMSLYDGSSYWNFDIRDASPAHDQPRLVYAGNRASLPLYGMNPAPDISGFKSRLWNPPANNGAKGGANGYLEMGDVILVRTTGGKNVWFSPTSIYAYGYPSDSVYFGMVYGCNSDLPNSLTRCP